MARSKITMMCISVILLSAIITIKYSTVQPKPINDTIPEMKDRISSKLHGMCSDTGSFGENKTEIDTQHAKYNVVFLNQIVTVEVLAYPNKYNWKMTCLSGVASELE